MKFFAELFYKKAGFWLLFSKSNITYKDFLILFLEKISERNFLIRTVEDAGPYIFFREEFLSVMFNNYPTTAAHNGEGGWEL